MSICCIRRNERRIIIADKHDIIFHNGKVRVILFVQIQDAVCRIVIHGSVFEVLNVLRIGRAGELVAQRGVLDGVKQERLYHEAVGMLPVRETVAVELPVLSSVTNAGAVPLADMSSSESSV